MGRGPCFEKNGVKKGPWTPEEDKLLIDCIHKNGCRNWRTLPNNAGLQRCGKSCRLRWTNYLRPGIKRGRFSFQEEETIIHLHSILGNKWSAIAGRLPGRTDNDIKNYWNTHIRKTLLLMGMDHHFRLAPLINSSLIQNHQTPFMIHEPPHMLTCTEQSGSLLPNSAYYGSGRPLISSLDTCTFQSDTTADFGLQSVFAIFQF